MYAYSPGVGPGMVGTEAWQFHGEVVILVEEGCIEADVGGEQFRVYAGDSLHFDPTLPHRWVAGEEKPAMCVVMAMIPERFQGDLMSRITAATGSTALEVSGIEALSDSA